ncbi:MAG: hypothetical protein ACI4PF_06625 [Christensenellales bacterium]
MEICNELINLANEFQKYNAKLYIVGGYVRDHLLGQENNDIDITSNLCEEKVLAICKKLKIETHNINKQLGTIQLIFNNQKFEYTRFRKESYLKHGTHTPDSVEFVYDINIDTLRRDFTINSIYYDISENKFIDISGGINDLKHKIIRTTNLPKITLSDDGLRILRAVRFSSLLNLKIEPKTLKALKIYTPLLEYISKPRILKELNLALVADLKYGQNNWNFLRLCNTLSLPQYIFNSSLSRMRKFNKKDFKNFYSLSESSRQIGFYVLILKKYLNRYTPENQLGFATNMLLGFNGLKESKNNIFVTEKIFRIYQNLEYGVDELNASINYLTLSSAERNIIDNFISRKTKVSLSDKISYIKDKNLPLSVHQLDICAQDLIDLKIEKKFISKILETLFNQVLNMSVPNENEALKKLALELHETFIKIANDLTKSK